MQRHLHSPQLTAALNKRALLAFTLLLGCAQVALPQLSVTPQSDLDQLAASITGPGVVISNPSITCHGTGFGEFSYSGSGLDVEQGVILTSGSIDNALGPNSVGNRTFQASTPGDAQLDVVTGRNTRDACTFEFDIIPAGDSLRFDFVFGSEEYNEWVGSQFNDVFGFFISGPGITGDAGIEPAHNIALVPGTSTAIAINNVNNGSNSSYYVDNTGGSVMQYDGFTTGLSARSVVIPCETYHLKLTVADASDRRFDSGVLINRLESNPVTMSGFTANGTPAMVEGCNPGWVRFTRSNVSAQPLALQYYLSGTATNGTDYTAIGNVNPAVPKTIVIPAGQAFVDRPIDPIADWQSEPTESLRFILGNPFCPAVPLDTLIMTIEDTLIATVQPVTATICNGGSVQYTIVGGASYAWSPATGLSCTDCADPVASPTTTTNYMVVITDGTCTRTVPRQVRVSNLALSAITVNPLCNGASNGAINLSLAAGIPPYSYAWTGPNGYTANTQDITGLVAGSYSVTVTDAVCTRTLGVNLIDPATLSISLAPNVLAFGQNISCHGGNDGSIDATIAGGTGPYTSAWSGPNGFTSTATDPTSLFAGDYAVSITDAHGCTVSETITLAEATPVSASITSTTPTVCFGDGLGSATVLATGGAPPYSYNWSTTPAQSAPTANGLLSGLTAVTVTDAYGCTAPAVASISGPTSALNSAIAARTHVLCFGQSTGSATVSASGGTTPYAFSWNTTPVQTSATATGLPAGNWICTITDLNGCTTTREVNISQPASALSASVFATTNVACFGANTGSATVSATGGSGAYTYQWNTVPVQNSATASSLSVGTYTCTVRDVNNCSVQVVVTITGPAAALSASIASQTDVACFGGNTGSVTINVAGGTGLHAITWNTTPVQNGLTATGLIAGNYTATITDGNGCSMSLPVSISQPAAPITTTLASSANVLCTGNSTGSATITATGGTGALAYTWNTTPPSNGASVTGLAAGTWTCTVTDANGCSTSRAVTITEPASALSASITGQTDVNCHGASIGTATAAATGGTGAYSYTWNTAPVQTAPTASGLTAGTWTCTVTDVNGCSAQTSATIAQPAAPLAISITAQTDVACYGASTGAATVAASGGTPAYTYSWSTLPAIQAASASALVAGGYTCTVNDLKGCSASTAVNIAQPAAPISVTATIISALCQGAADGSIQATIAGGTPDHDFQWSGPNGFNATSEDLTNLFAGVYVLHVTDDHGCIDSSYHNVLEPSTYTINATLSSYLGGANTSCANAADGSIDITVSGATPPYDLTWTGPNGFTATSEDVSGLIAGTYVVIINDVNDCATSASYTLTAPAPFFVSLNKPAGLNGYDIACSGGDDGSIGVNASGGTSPYFYTWSGPNGFSSVNPDIEDLLAGSYQLVAEDANGCPAQADMTLTEPTPIITSIQSTVDVSCNGDLNGGAQAAASGGVAPYAFQWNSTPPQAGASLSGVGAGTYTCTISDANGCVSTIDATVDEPTDALLAQVVSATPVACTNAATGSAGITISGGTAPYTTVWNTIPVQTGTSATGLSAGIWTASVTDAQGCTTSTAVTITQPAQVLSVSIASSSPVSCAGGSNGTATAVAAGGTGIVSYVWNTTPPQSGATVSNVPAGTYTVTATDANGCIAVAQVIISAPPTPLGVSLVSSIAQNCFGAATGQATVAASGGTSPYAYAWNTFPAQTSATASGLVAGTYSVTATDARGCTANIAVVVDGPSAPLTLTATSTTNILCHGAATGGATVAAAGGTLPYQYTWNTNPVTNGAQVSGLTAGSWTAQVVDGRGCTTSLNVAIAQPTSPLSAVIESQGSVSCFGGDNGWASLLITGGSGSTSTVWNTTPAQTGSNAVQLSSGSYTATITDNNGCATPLVIPITITQPSAPLSLSTALSNFNGANITCSGGADGWIDLSVSGGTAPYTHLWTDAFGITSTSEDRSGLTAGTYLVTTTDARGCTASSSITLVQPAPLQTAAAITTTACQGSTDGAIDVTISGGQAPYGYLWSGPNGFASNNADLVGLQAGVYNLLVTDANGCTSTTSFDVNQPGMFNVSAVLSTYAGGNNVTCAGSTDGSIDVTASGGSGTLSFAWSGPAGYSSSNEDLTGIGTGSYNLTVIDDNGCSTLNAYTLSAPAPLTVNLQATLTGGFAIACNGGTNGTINATPLGGTQPYVFAWSGPGGFTSATEDISALAAGTYSLLVTDQNGCTAQSSIVLSQPDPLSSSVILSQFANGDAISCAGAADGSIKLIVEGGAAPYTVQWSGPNGFTASGLIISGLGAGSYQATVTDANGCTYTSTVAINAPDPLGFTSALSAYIGGTEVSCHDAHDGSIGLTIAGGAGNTIFQWSGDQAFTSNSEDVSGLPAGTYTVVVTDQNGCSVTDDFVLNAPQPIQASAAITTAACQGASNGAIDLTTTGGTGPYGFFWSGPGAYSSAAEDITDLFAGVHTVTITDMNGCSLQSSFDVNQPGLFTISASVGVYPGGFNTSCALANDGYIDATVSGGTTPYYYFWNGPNGYTSITEGISGLSAGTYALTLTDQNGCSALAQYTIVSATALAASASATVYNGGVNTTCHEVPDGAIDAVINGGVPPYSTQWTGPDGYVSIAEDLSALAAGSYHLIVTDAVGCQTSLDIELTAPTALEATATISSYGGGYGVSCASANDGSIDLTIIGGTAPYNTTWTGPNGFSNGNTDISALTAGSYMASITDANGCTTSISVNLTAPSPIALSLQPSLFSGGFNIPCAGSNIGTINASASGGNGTLTFLWTGPNGFSSSLEDIEDLEAGSYTLTTTDENGCSNAATIELIGPAPVVVSTSLSDAGNGYQVSCLTNDGTISLTTTGGTQPIQYAWTGPNGFAAQDENITNLSAGNYFLEVTDANGCVLNDTITLTAPAPLSVDLVVSDAICHGSSEGSIQVNASGGTMPYTYVWSGPNGFTSTDEDIAGLVAGDYSVTISDAGTCSGTWTASITSTSALLADVYRSQYGSVNIPCAGDSTGVIEVAIAGGVEPVSIQWVGPSGFTSTEHNISGLIAGVYTFTITDGNNCVLDSTITLVQPALALQASPLADLAPSGDHIACFGGATGSIAATVIGGTAPYIYDWRGPDSVAFNTADISGLIAGEYELVVTDSNHCAIATSITLTEADSTSLTVTISEHAGGANTSCAGVNDGNIAVTISGGSPAFDLTWTGPNGFTATGDSISMLNAGDYLLTATDMNGCITDSLITIIAPDPLTWDQQTSTYAGGTNIRCADGADGSIQMTLAGGSGIYDILWTGPGGYSATTAGLDGLAAGEYCFQFTDENGCSASDCITLTQPEVLQASAQATSASCGQSNGNIDGAASGGTAPYSYAWSNGTLLEDLTSVGPDTYTLTVTDANGCVASTMVELTGAPALLAAVAISDVLCHGDQTGSIDLTPMTGTAPFIFSWTGGAQTEDLDALAAGSYQVQMTDAAGCSWSTICTVAEPTELQADSAVLVHANGFEVSALGASDGSIAVEASGGTAPYAYLWSNGATGSSVEGLGEGEWNVTITDANGCTRTLSFNLDAPNDVELPTGFTPNGDGQNDRFIVRGIENYPENELIVFNRWGNVVHQRINYKNDWAGENTQGNALPNGTYFILLRLTGGPTLQNYVDLRR